MSTTTAPKPATEQTQESSVVTAARKARNDAIQEYTDLIAQFEAERKNGNKKAAGSASAAASVRSARIRQAELVLATEGAQFTPWTKPTLESSKNGKGEVVSQEAIEDRLVKLGRVFKDKLQPETVKVTADQSITALLKQATGRGYQVTDPRK